MKKSILLVVFGLMGMLPAFGADIPVKAQPLFSTPQSSGWYAGIGTTAAVAQSNVSGNNLFATSLVGGNLNAAGGSVDFAFGYIRGQALPGFGNWYRLEASGSYQNITGSVNIPGARSSVASRWAAMQEADIGADVFQGILSTVGNLGVSFPTFTPSLPSNVAVAAGPRQYVGSATGSSIGIAPFVKSGFLWQALGKTGQPNGSAIDVFAWAAFPTSGFTMGNVLAANGTPVTINSHANLGTQYGMGLKYDFGL